MQMQKEKDMLKIGCHLVPWSFVYLVHKKCGGDWDMAIDCFWKARNVTTSRGIEKYIMAGLRPRKVNGKPARPYMLMPSREREHGQMDAIRQWWASLYDRRKKPDAEMTKRTDDIMAHLINKFKVPA